MLSSYFEPSPLTTWLLDSSRVRSFRPAVDIHEDDAGLHIEMDLAGVSPEDIKIDVEKGVLTISGERQINQESYHRVERFSGRFSRSFQLPDDVEMDSIEANHANGVLKLTLPRNAVSRRREIQVKALTN